MFNLAKSGGKNQFLARVRACRSGLEAVEEDADVEPETAGEVALVTCGVEEPVSLEDKAEFLCK